MHETWEGGIWDAHPQAITWVRDLATVVIVMANLYTVVALVAAYRHNRAAPSTRRLAWMLAGLIAVCGMSCLSRLLVPSLPSRSVPPLLRIISAGFWVVVAVHVPRLVGRLGMPVPVPTTVPLAVPPPVPLAAVPRRGGRPFPRLDRLSDKARRLEDLARDVANPRDPDRTHTLRNLRELLVELEADLCRN